MKRIFLMALALPCATLADLRTGRSGEGDPVADERAQVVCGQARFTVLTDRLLRLEYAQDGRFEDRASLVFVNRRAPVPAFTAKRDASGGCTIDTGRLRLTYRGGAFTPESLQIEGAGHRPFAWRFGDRDRGNLLGTTRTLDNVGDRSCLLERMERGILSRDGWAVVDDSAGLLFEPTDDHWGSWVAARDPGARLDLYFFGYGHDYKTALGDYVRFAGRIPLPPRFTFGYWWSRYWPYSDDEIEDIVAALDDYGIPLDVMIIDMDWHNTWGLGRDGGYDDVGQRVGWTGYTWQRGLFTNPRAFLGRLHDRHLRIALNLHPASGIQPAEDCYARFRDAYGWEGTNAIPYRLSERKWADCWYDGVLGALERDGVDFWWLDWQQWLTSKYVPGLSNTFWLNHTMARHEGEKRNRQGRAQRPLIYHRWGGLGSHRYQAGFSGDTLVRWSMLAAIPWFTATSGNVGYGYWGHDIGGHMDPKGNGREPEIFTRWLQSGVFTPLFKTHSSCNPEMERRIWMYPEHFDTMREAIRLRYRLAPYIYTAARAAYDTGLSICRPLYWDNPEDELAYSPFLPELRFGESIVALTVARHTDSNALASAQLWLPPETDGSDVPWYDAATGEMLPSGSLLTRRYTIDENPYFVRAGAVLPLNPADVRNLQTCSGERLELLVAPGAASGAGELYEDDGLCADYATVHARTRFTMRSEGRLLTLSIGAREGAYDGMPASRTWTIRLPNRLPPKRVTANGHDVAWRYDGRLPGVVATVGPSDPAMPCDISFEFDRPVAEGERLLAGMRGFCARARRLSVELKEAIELAAPMAMPPDSWLALASASSRLSEYPDDAVRILRQLADDKAAFRDRFVRTAALIPAALNAKIDAWLFPSSDGEHPDPADALTPCDLRADHAEGRAVRTEPAFSWRYTASRADAEQSACRVRVLDGAREIWDSRTVYGSGKGGLRYEGPSLAPGRDYTWELTLTDECGNESKPVRATFRTAADAPQPLAWDDGELGYAGIKRTWSFWRATGDATVIADNWERMSGAPVFGSDPKEFADGIRLIRAAWLMKEMAAVCGGEGVSARYSDLETAARIAFAARWQEQDGAIRPEALTAANLLMAFKARVMKANEVKRRMAARLADEIAAHGVPSAAGRFESEETLSAITEDAGLPQLAWQLVRDGQFSREAKADSVLAAAARDWRIAYAAGIRPHWSATGFVFIQLAPVVCADVDGISESLDTQAGRIASKWRWLQDGTLSWDVEIPSGSTAEVSPPDGGETILLRAGRHHLEYRGLR